jgi:hypothetical protein
MTNGDIKELFQAAVPQMRPQATERIMEAMMATFILQPASMPTTWVPVRRRYGRRQWLAAAAVLAVFAVALGSIIFSQYHQAAVVNKKPKDQKIRVTLEVRQANLSAKARAALVVLPGAKVMQCIYKVDTQGYLYMAPKAGSKNGFVMMSDGKRHPIAMTYESKGSKPIWVHVFANNTPGKSAVGKAEERIIYTVTEPYPATQVIAEITNRMTEKGWQQALRHKPQWKEMNHTVGKERQKVKDWFMQWTNQAGELVLYSLLYISPAEGPTNTDNLSVTAIYYPAKAAKTMHEDAERKWKIYLAEHPLERPPQTGKATPEAK